MKRWEIRRIPLTALNPALYNPRVKLEPGDLEYDSLVRSMQEFGCMEPIAWNEATGNIIGGHRRYDVLVAHGETETDVVVVHEDDPAREKLMNLALNNIKGRWDDSLLRDVIAELQEQVDLTIAGFDPLEVERMLNVAALDINDFFTPPVEPVVDEHKGEIQCPHCGEWFKK